MQNFYDGIEQYGENTAVITADGEAIPYSRFCREADEIAQGVKARNVVFLLCTNTREAITGYIGFLRKKAVPVMINETLDEALLLRLMELYQPAYLYGKKEKLDLLLKEGEERVSCFEGYGLAALKHTSYAVNEELGLLLTTSGSTGSPKLVRQSYKNITANADSIAEYLDIRPSDRAIMTLPMSYTYGLSIINSHLLKGACIIMNDYTLMDKAFWQLLKEKKATTFGGVPYVYDMLKKLRFDRMELPDLRYITQAGGKLSKEMAEEFNEICRSRGMKLIVMYGQTEATARMSYLPWERAVEKAGSIGTAIPGGSFELWDVNEDVIQDAEVVGELVYHGENVTLGYAQSYQDLIKGDERKGTLVTGDMAKRDADGFYYIVGRKKRFLKIFGSRINLDELEGMLKKEGYECACAGKDDELKIFTTELGKEKEIRDFAAGITHLSIAAFHVIPIEKIPRNEAGKVLYSALEE